MRTGFVHGFLALSLSSVVACTVPTSPPAESAPVAGAGTPAGEGNDVGGGPAATPSTDPSAPSGPSTPNAATPSSQPAGARVDAVAEAEPNDGPDMAGLQNVGALDTSRAVEISGRLTSGGATEGHYGGDFDGFVFEVPAGGVTLSASLDWEGSADVDAILYDANLRPIGGDNTTAKPVAKSASLPAGKYAVVLYSKNQAASYKLHLGLQGAASSSSTTPATPSSPPSPAGCIDAELLTGGYWQATTGGLSEIHFKSNGSIDYGSANPVSGTIWATGQWTLTCPTISVEVQGMGSKSWTVNGKTLIDNGGRRWVRCEPLSNGECF